MSATTLLRRTATVLTATAIAVPVVGSLGGSAFAAQPASHGQSAARETDTTSHGHRHRPASPAPAAHEHASAPASHSAQHSAAAAQTSPDAAPTGGAADPAGNNGTIFIHDVAGDHRPHNVPHVGCTFYVDFFGFDSNQVLSTSFVGQAPTGPGVALPSGDWTGAMPANGASGAGRDFDAEQAFTLDTSVLGAPQAQQGFHVKLTVSTGEPGGVKHKVFWISPCEQPSAPAVAAAADAPAAPQVAGLRDERAPEVLGLTMTRQLPAGVTRVLAVSASRTPSSLPFTGVAGIGILLAVAGAVLTVGGGLVLAGRRRTA